MKSTNNMKERIRDATFRLVYTSTRQSGRYVQPPEQMWNQIGQYIYHNVTVLINAELGDDFE